MTHPEGHVHDARGHDEAATGDLLKGNFPILGMSCASCAASVESILKSEPGVEEAAVNFASKKVLVRYHSNQVTPERLMEAVHGIGYKLVIPKPKPDHSQHVGDGDKPAPMDHMQHSGMEKDGMDKESMDHKAMNHAPMHHKRMDHTKMDMGSGDMDHMAHAEALEGEALRQLNRDTKGAVLFALPVFVIGMFFHQSMPNANWWMLGLTTPVLWFGRRFFVTGLKRLNHGQVNMDTLVALSTGIAYLFSAVNTIFPQWLGNSHHGAPVYFEAAAVVLAFILLGKVMEERAKTQAGAAIRALMSLAPKSVRIRRKDGSTPEVSVGSLQVGDVVLARAGEGIAVDGMVVDGESYVDESTITGESIPVKKSTGEKVYAGTTNQQGSFAYRADKIGSQTLLAQIIETVEEAQGSKPPVQKLADRISAVFVPVVMVIAVVTFIAWIALGGMEVLPQAMTAAISVLVIACPCALGLATPTALMVGIGRGAQAGILVRDAGALEAAYRLSDVVLDKTGTITEGKPTVKTIAWADGVTEEQKTKALAALLAIEHRSEHPLAQAIVKHLEKDALPSAELTHFNSVTGQGVQAHYKGQLYGAGNARLAETLKATIPASLADAAGRLEAEGQSIVFIYNGILAVAAVAIADQIKESSRQAIASLKAAGLHVHMLTGDNLATAQNVASMVNIDSVKAQVMPRDKSLFVEDLKAQGKTVAMAGDGVNDSEALALADVSIAMGRGSDVAMKVAGLTLMSGDLAALPKAISLSKATYQTVRRNLFWAFAYNVVAIPIAAGALYGWNGYLLDPMMAGAAMALSSVSVVLSSLYLKIQKI